MTVYEWIPISIVATTFAVGVTAAAIESGRFTWIQRHIPILGPLPR